MTFLLINDITKRGYTAKNVERYDDDGVVVQIDYIVNGKAILI